MPVSRRCLCGLPLGEADIERLGAPSEVQVDLVYPLVELGEDYMVGGADERQAVLHKMSGQLLRSGEVRVGVGGLSGHGANVAVLGHWFGFPSG